MGGCTACHCACHCGAAHDAFVRGARRAARRTCVCAPRRAPRAARVTVPCAARRMPYCAPRRAPSRDRGERGGVHTVDSRRWQLHHAHHDWVIGRNDWSPGFALQRLVDVEQGGLDVVHHGIIALLEKLHCECLRRVAMLPSCFALAAPVAGDKSRLSILQSSFLCTVRPRLFPQDEPRPRYFAQWGLFARVARSSPSEFPTRKRFCSLLNSEVSA